MHSTTFFFRHASAKLCLIGFAFSLVWLSLAASLADAQSADASNPAFIVRENTIQAEPFDLSQVRVRSGICKTNQDLDEKYLLSLDPERLLHNFRVNAGLPSTAQPLGGWEAPSCGLRGHFVGHYLSACAEMYAATGDRQLLDRGTYVVTELGKCQDALGTGYLSAFPASAFDTLETKFGGVWAPYYTIHKIMAGLLDQYHYCGNRQALDLAGKMADYFRGRMAKLTPEQIDKVLHTTARGPQNEFGGMSEVLHNLYAITKRQEYLDFADVFDRNWFLDPLALGEDKLSGLHANTHIPQVVGFARHYELTGDERYRRAADYFWSEVIAHHSYVTGSNSKGEHFLAPDVEAKALSLDTGETCNVYNMLKLTQHIFSWKADAASADYYELALYNHILGSIDPDSGMTTYFVPLKSGHFKLYGTPLNTFWCCTGTGIENHAKYGSAIYYHDVDSLWVNLFIPSTLTWQEKNLSIQQETSFPESDHTTLTITAKQPVILKMLLRVPYWASQTSVKINGELQNAVEEPDRYMALDRTWQNGDKIEYTLPMKLHLHRAGDDPNMVAIMYGPLVLAGDLGREGIPADDHAEKNTMFFNIKDPQVPSLAGDGGALDGWIKPMAGKALAFRTVNAGKPKDVELRPFYDIHHERYAIYWQFSDSTKTSSAP
jgi:DUF1680 family protein